jgi:cytochrome bd ubiquinol oxidase subunit I
MDVITLARIQFAVTVAFHFIFPSITIGLALLIAITETARWRTKRDLYDRMARFWTGLFAVTFVVGVATGIVMEFQFGTNWARYSKFVGDIFGAPLAAEGVFAFFLESVFLGILLWGRDRVSSGFRTFAAWMVAAGSTLSAFWIIVANSWMQTPAGFEVVGDKAVLTDFWAAVFNPSTLPRYMHTVSSSWAMGGFLMTGIAAWYLLKGRHLGVARMSLRLGLVVAFISSGLMFVTGDTSARQVATTQPAKFAAMQGLYSTTSGAPLTIWSLPPTQDPAKTVEGPEVTISRMLSFMTYGSFTAPVTGLDQFAQDVWPPIAPTFLAYHNMVLLGTLMLILMVFGLWYLWRGRIETKRGWLRLAVISIPVPLIAIQLGWAAAEVGRQPWIVYDLMMTAKGTSTAVSATDILISLGLLVATYAVLLVLWLYLLRREIAHGPAPAPVGSDDPAEAPLMTEPVPALRPSHQAG